MALHGGKFTSNFGPIREQLYFFYHPYKVIKIKVALNVFILTVDNSLVVDSPAYGRAAKETALVTITGHKPLNIWAKL